MTADHERLMGRLALQIEMIANRHGWDGPAGLYVLYDWHRGETEAAYRHLMEHTGEVIRCGSYAARPLVRSELLGSQPHHNLFRMAMNLVHSEHPSINLFLDATGQEGFLGMAFCVEAWARTYPTQEARNADGDVRFADMPGSIEQRNVWAVDTTGRDYYVERRRGERAKLVEDFVGASGAVVESIRAITARIAGQPVPEIVNTPVGWRG